MLIPESYVADLNVRMSLYRRLATIESREDIDRFAAELIDRFGVLPEEVQHLFEIVAIKQLCRIALVEKIDAGPKGGTIAFRGNQFPNPLALVKLINEHSGTMKVRPDQKVVVSRDWPSPEELGHPAENPREVLRREIGKALNHLLQRITGYERE